MQMHIARPVGALDRSVDMYCRGLGLVVLGRFADHAGFDGVMLGLRGLPWHFEFTICRTHPVRPTPTPEDLAVFYLPDAGQWQARCVAMAEAGFREVAAFNPYWQQRGRSFEDSDGYRLVLQQAEWDPS